MGLGVTTVPGLFASLPDNLRILADNGIVAGSLTAIVLNLIFNGLRNTKPTSTEQGDSAEGHAA